MNFVGVNAGGVDNGFGLQGVFNGDNLPAAVDFLHIGHFTVKLELNTVLGGIFRQGEGQAERTDDSTGGCIEGGHGVVGDVGFHGPQGIPLQNLQLLYAVFQAVFIQRHQCRTVFFAHHDHQRAVVFIVKIQFFGKLRHHPAALDIELCHQGTMLGVIACMNNGGIGFGSSAAHVFGTLDNQNLSLLAGQFPGNGAAGDTCADYDYIIHETTTPFIDEEKPGLPPPNRNAGQPGVHFLTPGP